jgi:hypothetical protein
MSYEILGNNGKYWTCHQLAWPDYLRVAAAFGWAPEGAFFKNDELGFGDHPSGSYTGNDWQQVTDADATTFTHGQPLLLVEPIQLLPIDPDPLPSQ